MYYIRLCKAGASICFLAASFFISWSMQPNKCNCFTHTQTNLDCRTAHTLICFAHKQCASKKKTQPESHACFLLMHTHKHAQTHTRISGDGVCIQALQNAHTESVPHLHRFKLPSGPIWRIWPPETHVHGMQYLSNTQPTCSCMHAKTNIHVHNSVTDIESVRTLYGLHTWKCDISSNENVNMHMLESCPDNSEDKQNISSVFQYVPKRGSRPADAHACIHRQWMGQVNERERRGYWLQVWFLITLLPLQ